MDLYEGTIVMRINGTQTQIESAAQVYRKACRLGVI
jgi:hypothetical protein